MQSNFARVLAGIAAVAAAVILLLVLKDDGDDKSGGSDTMAGKSEPTAGGGKKPAEPQTPTIVVDKSGQPVGGIAEIEVDQGEEVRFEVKSAIAEEVHVHGYDLMKDVPAGGSVTF